MTVVKFSSDYPLIDTQEKFPDNQMLSFFSHDYKLNENDRYPINTNIAHSNVCIQEVYKECIYRNLSEKDLPISNLMG